jgi:hypothetical protein
MPRRFHVVSQDPAVKSYAELRSSPGNAVTAEVDLVEANFTGELTRS